MSQPTAMAFAPDGRIFVTQQGGAMRVIKNGSLLPTSSPMITSQPASITVMSGQPAIFVVEASGTDLSYQWLKDGMVIPGATGNSYLIPSSTTANQGQYQAVVSSPGGSVTSNAASLVVQMMTVDPVAFNIAAPLYNCQTGALTFQTTGGNGTPIEYFAIGVTPWTTNPNQTVEAGLRADPKPIQLYARQNGITVSYTFDLAGFCGVPSSNQPSVFVGPLTNQNAQQGIAVSIPIIAGTFTDPEGQPLALSATGLPIGLSLSGNMIMGSTGQVGSFPITIQATDPGGLFATGQFTLTVTPTSSGSALQLLAPLYNCQTGAITFQTTGGNGTMIEYFAIGITPWTTNPNQFVEAGLRADPKMITLNARQSGIEVTYQFNLPAACAATRVGNPERDVELSAQIFPNPVRDVVTVGVEGAQGQRVRFLLTDLTGRTVSEQVEEVTSTQHRTTLNIANKASGMYVLRVSTGQKAVSLKVLKQE